MLCPLSRVIRFRRVGGASAGAINASGIAFGFTPEAMVKIWTDLLTTGHKGKSLEDWKYPGVFKPLGMFQGKGGCMRGDVIREALQEIFGRARMGDAVLPLRIKVGGLARRRTETVYSDLESHKRLFVVDAVMCSLAVPFLIDNQQLDPPREIVVVDRTGKTTGKGWHEGSPELYCDGGLGNNVPRALWDDIDDSLMRPTTILHFMDGDEIVPVKSFRHRLRAYINIMRDACEDEQSKKPKEMIWDVPLVVTGDPLDFSLTKDECARREKMGLALGEQWIADNTPA